MGSYTVVNVNCEAKIPTGVISACQNGIYIGQDVQALACEKGWRYSASVQMVMKDDDDENGEAYTEAWDEAEEWLNINIAEDDHYFGSQPMAGCGCWGYWEDAFPYCTDEDNHWDKVNSGKSESCQKNVG